MLRLEIPSVGNWETLHATSLREGDGVLDAPRRRKMKLWGEKFGGLNETDYFCCCVAVATCNMM